MNTGRGESLAQRIANTQTRQVEEPTASISAPLTGTRDSLPSPPPTIKHCWYDGPHGRQAALLLGWRTVLNGHDGRIAVAAPDGDAWAVVEMWVDSGMLAPS